jgi:excisionase family DNA binding protein
MNEETSPMNAPADILTVAEAAKFLRIEKKLLYKLIDTGEISAKRVGRAWRISRDTLVAYINKGESNE